MQCRRMDGSNFLSGGEVQSGVLGTDEMSGPSCTLQGRRIDTGDMNMYSMPTMYIQQTYTSVYDYISMCVAELLLSNYLAGHHWRTKM